MTSPKIITSWVLVAIFILMLLSYLFSFKFLTKDVIIFCLTVIQIISFFLIFYESESFYFEVSPRRKKCLEEQVSLNPSSQRSCHCCGKGTVGGYPPVYTDWLTPQGENELWKRPDNYTTNQENGAYETQIPPTEYVSPVRRRVRKTFH